MDFLWALEEQIDFYDAIGYERMEWEVVAYYLKAGSWYLPKVRDILRDRKTASRLRWNMRRYMSVHPLEKLPLTEGERQLIRKVTPSVAHRFVRKIRSILK